MKRAWKLCLIGLMLVMVLLIPITMASAEKISSRSGAYTSVYEQPNTNSKNLGGITISSRDVDPPVDGWYYLPNSLVGAGYVRTSDVVSDAPPPWTPPPVTPTPVPGTTITPAPGVSPTPEVIGGTKDPNYTGTILNYTVPVGGLSLYDRINGSVVEIVTAGIKLTLNQDIDTTTNQPATPSWYYTYYRSKTYYVQESLLNLEISQTGSELSQIQSVLISADTMLFTGFNATSRQLTGQTNNKLTQGTRVNARYYTRYVDAGNVSHYIYVYTIGTTAYYFDGTGMSTSSATVGSSNDTTMMTRFVPKVDARLYVTKSDQTSNFFKMDGTETLYGNDLGDGWCKVMYANSVYYIKTTDIETRNQVATSGTVGDGTFYITISSEGANVYKTRQINYSTGLPITDAGNIQKFIAAGSTVIVGTYDSNWYSYTESGKVYYIFRRNVADTVAAGSVTSIKVFLPAGTVLWKKLTEYVRTEDKLPTSDYYVVRSVDNEWYSIVYENKTYYIKKSETAASSSGQRVVYLEATTFLYQNAAGGVVNTLEGVGKPAGEYLVSQATTNDYNGEDPSGFYLIIIDGSHYLLNKIHLTSASKPATEPIANTATGKTYVITIGVTGATLYTDSSCTVQGATLQAGAVVNGTKYTETLYLVDNSGAKYYLPVRYVASIRGGDDASIGGQTGTGSIDEVIKGETNSAYTETVLSYTIPQSGLWLYSQRDEATKIKTLNAGTSIKLNTISGDAAWYTTWYGGAQYYVPKKALTVAENTVTQAGTYSIKLARNVTLYTSPYFTTTGYKTTIQLTAGTRINVRVHSLNTDRTIAAYVYVHFDGKTYYFPAKDPGSGDANVDVNDIQTATVASNSDTSLITKFVMQANTWVYSEPNTGSRTIVIQADTTIFGKLYNADWYQVIYDNTTWYLKKSAYTGTLEQIAIAGGASSTTFTVVVGPSGARLYTKPQTNTYAITGFPAFEQNWYNSGSADLKAGQTVLASRFDSSWYTYAADGLTLYFMANNSSNTNSNEAVRSYTIVLYDTEKVSLYNSVSDTAEPTKHKISGTAAGAPFTLRQLDNKWSSIVYFGRTYYVKNADIANFKRDTTAIASTSVGGTYQITVGRTYASGSGDSISVYGNSKLTGVPIGQLEPGRKLSGTKMWVDGASTLSSQNLVYAITYGNRTGYIDAAYVTGVQSGDEVTEAQQAAQNQQGQTGGGTVPIGTEVIRTLNANTKMYYAMDINGDFDILMSTMSLTVKKENATWFSTMFFGKVRYLPAVDMETGSNSGGTASVGEKFSLTFLTAVDAFAKAELNQPVAEVIKAGETYNVTKMNDVWYEIEYKGGRKLYALVAEVRLPAGGVTPPPSINTNVTTDGTGIITAYVLINPSSGTVNMRKAANTTSTVLDRIPKGTQVKNNSYVKDTNGQLWYNVTYNGKTGFVLGQYVVAVGTVADTSSTANPASDIGKALIVNVSPVNIRSGPGTNYSIVGTLEKGATIVPTDIATGNEGMTWYKFQFNAKTIGYIRFDYVSGGSVSSGLTGNVAIKSGGTNLRSGAGETFSLITKLDRDVVVTIIGQGTDNTNALWYNVTVVGANLKGYVRADLVRPLTTTEAGKLQQSVIGQYTELKPGDKNDSVRAMQQQLISIGYLAAGSADGSYGSKTTSAVKAFQSAKGLSATGIATPATQAAIFNTTIVATGSTKALDWFAAGYALINQYPYVQIYDIKSGTTWNAKYINGSNHADVIPASTGDAAKLTANNITGSYIRRPVVVTINGSKFAGSMYAVGHGSTNYCSYFSGVMCIHFTGSKTHVSGSVDADHQSAINDALNYQQ